MQLHQFTDQHIHWQRIEFFDNFQYSVLDVDRDNKVVEVLFKFAANDPIVLHRHCAVNHTFVIQGEHCLYHADGTLTEKRPTGSYTISQPDNEPHRESGGDEDTVVLFSIRATEGPMYENNLAVLKLLTENPKLAAALPLSQELVSHLTLWLNKYERVFKSAEKMCLLYVGVEDGAKYPSNFDQQVKNWIEENQ